ncbi:hypothetical protein RZS08_14255 [Arthrospira platensis SPKY1]|nr:hypothetical protein [Arthrospira platensis SPKY1]
MEPLGLNAHGLAESGRVGIAHLLAPPPPRKGETLPARRSMRILPQSGSVAVATAPPPPSTGYAPAATAMEPWAAIDDGWRQTFCGG